MQRFAELYRSLDASTGTRDKLAAMRAYFAEADPADAAWAVAALSGRKLCRAVAARRLKAWAAQETRYPPWLIEACHEATGDLAEALALLPPREGTGEPDVPLHEVVERRVLPLSEMSERQQRDTVVEAWRRFDAIERFLYHKLISSSLRVGVQKKLLIRALAEHAGLDPGAVALRLSGTWRPTAENFRDLLAPADPSAPDAAGDRPYPFCLAHPLDVEPEALGDPGDWLIEWKWDGIRAQAIRRSGAVHLWSRGEELVTPAFPEIAQAVAQLGRDAVLDGEILAWSSDGPLPFAELQKRLHRKRVEPSLFPDVPVAFVAYDLLERDGRDRRDRPLRERRGELASLLDRDEPALRLSPRLEPESWSEVRREVDAARDRGVEGVMLKRGDSAYGVGRPRGVWWKWKVAPHTVDAVLVQAEQGHGRRAGLFTAYTFAVWDRRSHPDAPRLTPVTRAYTGLTHDEIERLDRWIRGHTTARHGPVRVVEPHWVFEIAFEAVQRSPRHKAGVALRFPRMNRWRSDKAVDHADDLDSLLALLPDSSR